MGYSKLYYEKKDRIIEVTFNDPQKMNALSGKFLDEFSSLLDEIEADRTLQVVILTGAGKAFIAGADISYMQAMIPEEAAAYAEKTTEIYRRMEASKKIFIAAINGFALGGGCEMTLACDLRIASTKARIGLPEVSLGIFPGGGGTQRLPRIVGMTKAKELVYTGKNIKADEAEKIGLVNMVCEPEELMAKAEELAGSILANSMSAVSLSKESFNNGAQMDISSAMDFEKNLFSLCFSTEDQKEGMTAFLEKRPANFK